MKYFLPYFAQAYGSGAYGACTYQPTTQQLAACNGTTSSSSGLVNTGIAVAAFVALAAAIIVVSILVRVWKRKKVAKTQTKNVAQQPKQHDE